MKQPAVLGGPPSFPDGLPVARPALPPLERVTARLAPSYAAGQLTDGPVMRDLEERLAERLGVRNAVAVSSCTSGLMLAILAVAPAGPVVVPSFTFSATAHAVVWNRLVPVFADCLPTSFQLDPDDLAHVVGGAGLIVATHVFGSPCDAEEIEAVGAAAGVPVMFDSAHALGATRRGRPIGGFGVAEVFSLTPTKPLVAGEGGIVATDSDEIADFVRAGRNYGNDGSYDPRFAGLNARMSELHAALAREALEDFDIDLARRQQVGAWYRAALADVPGVHPQHISEGDRSTFKDVTIVIDPEGFGGDRDLAACALAAEGIDTRKYFFPPVHRQRPYSGGGDRELLTTDRVAGSVLSLPMAADMDRAVVERVAGALAAIQARVEEVAEAVGPRPGRGGGGWL